MKMPPLTPRTGGGLCIGTEALQPADIIVSTAHGAISGVIRAVTASPISHAMLYVGNGNVIEAVGEGVLSRSLPAALHGADLAVAYRYKNLPATAAASVVAAARAIASQRPKYDLTGALGAGARSNVVLCVVVFRLACPAVASGAMNDPNKFFCSELVLEAYRRAGFPITNTPPSSASPDRIVEAYSDGKLIYVGHIIG